MSFALWFVGGLVLVAAISYGAFYLYRLKSEREVPLPPERLPKDWDSVMPRDKNRQQKQARQDTEPSFRKVGVKRGSKKIPGNSKGKLK